MSTSKQDIELALAEEISHFYDDPLGHVMFSYPWGEGSLAGFTGPDEWQREGLIEIGKAVRERGFNGLRAVDPIQFSWASGHGVGKAKCLKSKVFLPSGEGVWGDLRPGGLLFDEHGQPVRITATMHYRQIPFYRVAFDDGSHCDVSSGHLWNVRGRRERRNKLDGWRTMETIEILEAGVKRPNGAAMARQWEIPIQGAVEFEEREIDLHPYLMGVWIGDGSKGQPVYTKPYIKVADKLRSLGYTVISYLDGKTHRIQNVSHLFRAPEFQRGSSERYIPDDYKYNTPANRMALLEGLCDTDGEVHASGSIGYSTTSLQLAEDVIWLARSLGCKAMLQPAVKHAWYLGEDGERIECWDCYRVTINAPFNPFTVEHRRAAYRPSETRYLKRWIDSIEYIGEHDGMCVEVDSATGLYQTEGFHVTHNSALVAWLIRWIMDTRPHCKGVVSANTNEQLRTKTWSELAKWHSLGITSHWFTLNFGGALNYYHNDHKLTWRTDAQTCEERNSESFAGLHAAHSTPFFIFDEASSIPDKIWEVREGGLTDGEPMTFDFGNPTRNSGRFYENMQGRYRQYYRRWFIDSREVAITNKELLDRWIEQYGEDSDFVKVRVKGEFPSMGDLQFISSDVVDKCVGLDVYVSPSDPVVVGVDVARYGSDESVILTRHGRDAEAIPHQRFRGADTMQLAARVVAHAHEHMADAVLIDGGGVGGGVIDRCRQLGLDVIEINFGNKATQPGYARMRDQCWGNMKKALKDGIRLPDDPDVRSDLVSLEYGYNARNELVIESKDDAKKRGIASPDLGDALALTYAVPIMPSRAGYDGMQNTGPQHEYDPFD